MSDDNFAPLLVYLIAGEPSGDALGADLMASLKARHGKWISFAGIGGDRMIGEGLNSLFPMSDLSVMGLVEVVPRLPTVLRRLSATHRDVLARAPDVLVTIDSPDFCFRVAKRVKHAAPSLPVVHLGAPTVWAWRPGRARKVARFLDHMLCLYPFEPPYFEREGLSATFIGHPIAAQSKPAPTARDLAAFRRSQGIADGDQVLLALPGSRTSELHQLLPLFGKTALRLQESGWQGRIIVPTLAKVTGDVVAAVRQWPFEPIVVHDELQKTCAFAISDAALAASGTVLLELAAQDVPTVVAYKLSFLTGLIARRLIKLPYVGLINILMERSVMPEFLQEDCRPDTLAPALLALLQDKAAAEAQRVHFAEALALLAGEGGAPGDQAARVVSTYLDRGN